ncbi:hypothetical protein L4C38_18905 [Vibrio kasasachensis]|uniref:hypothetical protein n=1 Tax=Vibrio kasasachensis TaxID=2910248 RepID=UPI003D14C1E0
MKSVITFSIAACIAFGFAPMQVEAAKVHRPAAQKRVVPNHFTGRPVYRAPVKKVYVGKPYRVRGWNYWAHPIASAVAFAIVVDATGNLQDEQGNDVVVLGGGGKVKETYTHEGTVYIITE